MIVYLHDYHVFADNWYKEVKEFGLDWDIQMHQIRLQNGKRMFDWVAFDHPIYPRYFAIPYERTDCVPYQYISGGYWVCKRQVMIDEPLNENLLHFQAEDVEWSYRVRNKYKIVMNPKAIVQHNKPHRELNYVDQREAEHARYY